jgi:hypothetical protein
MLDGSQSTSGYWLLKVIERVLMVFMQNPFGGFMERKRVALVFYFFLNINCSVSNGFS